MGAGEVVPRDRGVFSGPKGAFSLPGQPLVPAIKAPEMANDEGGGRD